MNTNLKDKIKACFILGACGDALGAPLEAIRKLEKIIELHGENGLREIIEYDNQFEKGLNYPAGRVTDDTTMAMTTAAALILTLRDAGLGSNNFITKLNYNSWQGYLNWASFQYSSDAISNKIDQSIKWPNIVNDFWFACGAGGGTIAALSQNTAGSIEKPLDYSCEIRGKLIKSPNSGCGGMMRVAPLAFVKNISDQEVFELTCRNAAITHGAQEAYVATGVIGLYIYYALKNLTPEETIEKTKKTLEAYIDNDHYKDGINKVLEIINKSCVEAIKNVFNFNAIDKLPKDFGYKNPFRALPVLAQVTYSLLYTDSEAKVKDALILSVNHSGDSDSVGAILGNILGARYGTSCIPQEWSNMLLQKNEIENMSEEFFSAIKHSSPAPK